MVKKTDRGGSVRPQDIKIGEHYRFRAHPNYSYAKAIEVIPAKTGINTHSYKVVKCEHIINKNDTIGIIRYFRPVDLIN
ncbi:MAG: hypothetical protein KAT14_00230 [Candidatus Marinimicrobia bacterium]|nr:hypothetical protein [Candidatus Neomarinimicrobiota bacterium]